MHKGVGESNGDEVYLNGHCNDNFSDIRFLEVNGTHWLDYWMERYTSGVNATVWVELDEITTNGTDFYIYYGNPGATPESDGEATWDFFDDFSGSEVDSTKWDEVNDPGGTVADGKLTINKTVSHAGIDHGYQTNGSYDDCRMVVRGKTNYSQAFASAVLLSQYGGLDCLNEIELRNLNAIQLRGDKRDCGGDVTNNVTNDNYAFDTYYTYYYVRQDADHIRAWEDGLFRGLITTNIRDASDPGAILVSFWGSTLRTQDVVVDWYGVGKYCSPEPELGVWVPDTSEPTPTPSPTPTSTATATPSPSPTATPTSTADPSGWGYHQQGTVNASASCGNQSDYQMQLVVHRGVGNSSGSDVYLNNHCDDNFSDVRFMEVNGTQWLDYWVEEYVSGVNATVWVEFDEILVGGTDFNIYYGDSNASPWSDGEATWEFFDDFPGSAVNGSKWDEVNGPDSTVANSELTISMTDSNAGICYGYQTNASFDDCRMLARGKTGYSQAAASAILIAQYNGWKCSNKIEMRNNNDIELRGDTRDCGGDLTINVINSDFATDTYYTYYYARQGDEHLRAWEDGAFVGEVTGNIRNASDPGAILISFWNSQWRTQDVVVDWFGVGKYCDPEPEMSSWIPDASEPTPSPTPTATATSTPTPTPTATS